LDLSGLEDLAALLLTVVVLCMVIGVAVSLTGKRGIEQATAIDFILALAIGGLHRGDGPGDRERNQGGADRRDGGGAA
jgi:hypothetical protein